MKQWQNHLVIQRASSKPRHQYALKDKVVTSIVIKMILQGYCSPSFYRPPHDRRIFKDMCDGKRWPYSGYYQTKETFQFQLDLPIWDYMGLYETIIILGMDRISKFWDIRPIY